WTLTPADGFVGTLTLTYTVSDGHGGELAGQTRDVTFTPNKASFVSGASAPVVFFRGVDAANGLGLWVTDGAEGGAPLVKDINPGTGGSFPQGFLAIGGGKFVFQADDGTNGTELWVTNGTEEGTERLTDINPNGASSGPVNLTAIGGGKFVFAANSG